MRDLPPRPARLGRSDLPASQDPAGITDRAGVADQAAGPDEAPDHHGAASRTARTRLDTELVRRGLARSRTHAARLVAEGRVTVDGRPGKRASQPIPDGAVIVLPDAVEDFASRAGGKLAGALDSFIGLSVSGRRCLDAGASTGGFTDVLLRRGAASVLAVDVGTGQLRPELAADARVQVREGTDIRDLHTDELVDGGIELAVVDLSFISVTKVLPALSELVLPEADLVILVKPQFEVGRAAVGRGVVADPALWQQAVSTVAASAAELGWVVRGEVPSTVPGRAGNREFLLWLSRAHPPTAAGAGPGSGTTETSGVRT